MKNLAKRITQGEFKYKTSSHTYVRPAFGIGDSLDQVTSFRVCPTSEDFFDGRSVARIDCKIPDKFVDGGELAKMSNDCNYGPDESEANAELIAQAFNVTNQSGLTPSELLKQRDDLLEALKNWFVCADEHETTCMCGREKAKAAIAKAEGGRK